MLAYSLLTVCQLRTCMKLRIGRERRNRVKIIEKTVECDLEHCIEGTVNKGMESCCPLSRVFQF